MPRPALTLFRTVCALLAGTLVSACGTFVTATGEPLSRAETVTLNCYWRYYFVAIDECHVSSVDGQRPGPLQFASLKAELAPGQHWVEFETERYFGGAGGRTGVCAFETVYRPALTCATSGSLCRTVSDCAPHPDAVCRPQPDYAYGLCQKR